MMIINFHDRPIGNRRRIGLSAAVLTIALVFGFGCGAALTQYARHAIRESDRLGRWLCGPGQHIERIPVEGPRRGFRLICADANGKEVGARNNGLSITFALPFILLIALPGLWFVWSADIRMKPVRRT